MDIQEKIGSTLFNQIYSGFLSTVNSALGEQITQKVENFVNAGSEFVGTTKETVQEKLSEFIKEGTFLGDGYNKLADVLKINALNVCYVGAGVGSLTVMNSTINLLQKKADENLLFPKKDTNFMGEALKILVGSALIGLSITYGASDALERAKIINVTLGLGLANAAWRASIVVKPTFLVFQLKAVECSETLKDIEVFPES